MPTELTNLDLMEVSLVDAGDDPLAKVALFKRKSEEDKMEDNLEEDLTQKKVELEDEEDEMMDEADDDKKPARKSWKAEALAQEEANKSLLEEVETLKGKIAELEKAAVEKAKPAEEMLEVDGEMIAKSAIPAPILKKLEDVQKALEAEELRKRADEVLPNFKGTADERGKLLKSVEGEDELLALLLAADAAFAGLFKEVGKTDAENDLKTPTEKLNDIVKAYQEEKKEKDFHKAYAAVIKTAQGRSLVLETYKK
jgi:hypothetical protein